MTNRKPFPTKTSLSSPSALTESSASGPRTLASHCSRVACRGRGSGDPQAWRASTTGVQDALIDIWLLGECDELILSPGSTFGRSATQRTSVRPHVIPLERDLYKPAALPPGSSFAVGAGGGGGGVLRGAALGKTTVGPMGARKPVQPTTGQCTRRPTSESCFYGWKNFFASGRRNVGERAGTPGFEFMAADWRDVPRVQDAQCVTQHVLRVMRYHADCTLI